MKLFKGAVNVRFPIGNVRFPIEYRYFIIENGSKSYGTIISDNGKSYRVRWDDGQITTELDIDPATRKYLKEHK